MMTLEEIKASLQDRVSEKVSTATGIHRNTVNAIRSGKNDNPTYQIMVRLSEYLESKGAK